MVELLKQEWITVDGHRQKRLSPLPDPPSDLDKAPTLDNFRIAFHQHIRCNYNALACEVFVSGLMASEDFSPWLPQAASPSDDPVRDNDIIADTVRAAFWIHVEYLYSKYDKERNPPPADVEASARAIVNTRKRRNTVSLLHTPMQQVD